MPSISSTDEWSEHELHRLLERELDFSPKDIDVELQGSTVLIHGTVQDSSEEQRVQELISNELNAEAYEVQMELNVDSSHLGATNPPRNLEPRDRPSSPGQSPSVRRQY